MLSVFFACLLTIGFVLSWVQKSSDLAIFSNEVDEVKVRETFHLQIPKIKVDAIAEPVGLTPEGLMDVPSGPNVLGWFGLGPQPGESGSAVIDGHSGWKNNVPAVFDNLHKLRTGDKIYIEDKKGTLTIFVVREIRKYNPEADAGAVFSSHDGKAHLNLITCTGAWDSVKKSSSERLVVFADKE